MRELVRAHAEDGEVGVGVVADQRGGQLAAVGEEDAQLLRTVDHMAVGEQVAVGRNEEAGAGAARSVVAANLDMDDGRMRGGDRAGDSGGIGVER